MALAAIENGADKIRINPGNIGNPERVKAVVDAAKERNTRNSSPTESFHVSIFPDVLPAAEAIRREVSVLSDTPNGWTVSYTHLDVYKRQIKRHASSNAFLKSYLIGFPSSKFCTVSSVSIPR